jgi:hypothetical protein
MFSNPEVLATFNQITQNPSALSCPPGSDCSNQNTLMDLEKKYNEAVQNRRVAPRQVDIAEKNYYSFKLGTAGYRAYIEDQMKNEANKEIDAIKTQFSTQIGEIKSLAEEDKLIAMNYANAIDLVRKYRSENKDLRRNIHETKNKMNTSDRKSFYESQKLDGLTTYYKWLRILYILVALAVFYSVIFSKRSLVMKVLVVLGVVLFPFVITPIVRAILKLIFGVVNKLPRDVYLHSTKRSRYA